MKKMCVMICGTNRSGKTTTARALLYHFGGVGRVTADTTYSKDGRIACAGLYKEGHAHGGVDSLARTDTLEGIVRRALETVDVVFAEGSYIGGFGMNPMKALFAAERQLYVFLYCSAQELRHRQGARKLAGDSSFGGIIKKQQSVLRSAKKYADIGVPLLSFDTGVTPTEDIVNSILRKIETINGG